MRAFLNFDSRKTFDNYMKNIETCYYDAVKLPKSPYIDLVSGQQTAQLPEYPPVPTHS